MRDSYWRKVRLKSVVDGDTVRLYIDLGFRNFAEHSIRLSNVVAPRAWKPKSEEEQEAGNKARFFVEQWFRNHFNNCNDYRDRWPFLLNTERADGFGRYLGRIYCNKSHCLNDDIVNSGLARPYVVMAE